MPPVSFPGLPVDLRAEARKARRLYPVSLVYSAYGLTVLALVVRAAGPWRPAFYYGGGALFWTAAEYLAHRYTLHRSGPSSLGSSSCLRPQ